MAKLQCDICGGQLKMQAGGNDCLCENCGMGYTVDRMKEIYSGIKVSVTGSKEDVQQWKALLGTYMEAFDFTEAEKIVKKILEASPSDTQAQELYRNLKDWKHLDIRNNVLVKYNGAAEQVVIPHGVTAIGDKAFSGCNSIFSVMLPDSVTRIGNEAFQACQGLKKISLSRALKSIGYGAFGYCGRIERIDIPGTVSEMGGGIFKLCKQLKTVTLGDGLKKLGNSMFAQCENLESLKLPLSLCEIGEGCFEYSGIQSITIPEGVMIVEENTFNQCQKLSDVTLPQSLTVIKDNAFYGCKALPSIEIPQNVVKIGGFAFENCSKLQDITLHEGVREIGLCAFSGRPKNIRIPDSVISYSDNIFVGADPGRQEYEYMDYLRRMQATPDVRRKAKGRCQHCGGEFKGVFNKACTACGKPKDY